VKLVVVAAPKPAAARASASFCRRNRTVILFVLFLIAADFGVGLLAPVWDRHSPDDYLIRLTACAERPRDLVFVGGSPVTEGIDPLVIAGARWRGSPLSDAYSIGLRGGTASDYYYAVRRACPGPPRVIVYGATATDLNDSRNEPHGARVFLAPGDVVELARTRPDAAEWVVRHYLQEQFGRLANVYHHRHGIRMWAAVQADALVPGCCPDTVRQATEQRTQADDLMRSGTGYAPLEGYKRARYDQFKAAGLPPAPFAFLNQFQTGSHLKYTYKLAQWCRARGTELIVVDMPVTADLEAKYPAEFAEYRERLVEFERTHGVTVIRDTRAAGLTDEHFADLIHLTPAGCRKFSSWLRGRLEVASATTAHKEVPSAKREGGGGGGAP
jgi:hypothetical protein